MDSVQVLEMLSSNREYIKRKSNIALLNLSMLHRSFDSVIDSGVCDQYGAQRWSGCHDV
jgi:hypothetical protein